MVSASSLFLLIIGSGGASLEFARFVAGEIGGGGAFDAVLTVDGGVDLVTRKNEPIFLGLVFHASHFAEPQERGRFFHGGVVFRFARGLEILQHGEVLLQAPIDALLVEREELELFRLLGESVSGGEGGIDLGDIGACLAAVLKLAEGKEVVFDGADSVETPAVGGDALGELSFHGSLGRKVVEERLGEVVMGRAIFLSHRGDLTCDAVAQRVHAGALVALRRFRPC